MTTFLLLLSLILNAAAIFAIILLYLRQNRLVEAEKKQERLIGEIEEVFSAYLLELKEENDKFIETMKKAELADVIKPEPTAAAEGASGSNSGIIHDSDKEVNEISPRIGRGISYQAARKAYSQKREPSASIVEDPVIKENKLNTADSNDLHHLSFNDQVFLMEKQGLSVEEIARKLDKGKTEIELLLKFRQNT